MAVEKSIGIRVRDIAFEFDLPRTRGGQRKRFESSGHVGASVRKAGDRQILSALRNVTFDLSAGDRLAIIGPNGAGKTTLLRLLAGIYQPDRGSIEVTGSRANALNIGFGIRNEPTGRQNIVTKALIGGWPRKKMDAFVAEVEDFAGLGTFMDAPVRTYSQGMRARLAFGIATAMRSDILLLDEWLGAGDEDFRERAKQRMDSLVEETPIVVLASHNRNLLSQICTKGLLLERGEQKYYGSLDGALEYYNSNNRKT